MKGRTAVGTAHNGVVDVVAQRSDGASGAMCRMTNAAAVQDLTSRIADGVPLAVTGLSA